MATYDAVTMDEARDSLGISGFAEDEALQRLVSALTLEIERRLGTQFVQRSLVEYHEGGGKHIYLGRAPIVSVASIVDPAGNVVAADQFVIRQQRWLEHWGRFYNAYTSAGQPTDWTVTYTAGWFATTAAVSPDVKAEILRAVAGMREAPAAGVASVGVGDLSISYSGRYSGEVPTTPVVDGAVAALHAFRGVLL